MLCFCGCANYIFASGQFFLKTENFGMRPLFEPQEKWQDVFNSNFDKEISAKQVTSHSIECNGYQVNFDWYQNGKPFLVLLALGKGATFEAKVPFIRELVKNYDVIVFDYEWQNPANLFCRISRIATPLARYFEGNYREVQSIVAFVRQQNKYKKIIGHAECYSSFMFLKAQATRYEGSPMFDKLVLDSPLWSVKNYIKSILKNPALCWDFTEGRLPDFIKTFLQYRIVSTPLDTMANFFVGNDYSVEAYLEKIDIPTLFVRGSNDPAISASDFEKIWETIKTSQKAVFVTPYHHSNSFKKEGRRRYLFIENLFIQNEFEDFVNESLKTHKH